MIAYILRSAQFVLNIGLDGVGHHFVQIFLKDISFLKCKKNILTCDRWHVTGDTWQVTGDTWHLTPDTQCGINILSKYQLPSSSGLELKIFWLKDHSLDEGDCGTAPDTPGLLKSLAYISHLNSKYY